MTTATNFASKTFKMIGIILASINLCLTTVIFLKLNLFVKYPHILSVKHLIAQIILSVIVPVFILIMAIYSYRNIAPYLTTICIVLIVLLFIPCGFFSWFNSIVSSTENPENYGEYDAKVSDYFLSEDRFLPEKETLKGDILTYSYEYFPCFEDAEIKLTVKYKDETEFEREAERIKELFSTDKDHGVTSRGKFDFTFSAEEKESIITYSAFRKG